jgi:tetratricopeptide (TPR) repeat protein
VLSEEALIVLVALAACGLLALGVGKLVRPPRSRRPEQGQDLAGEQAEPAVEPSIVPRAPVAAAQGTDPTAGRPPRVHRTSAVARHGLRAGSAPYVRRPLAPPGTEADPHVAVADTEAPSSGAAVVQRCFALYGAGRHADAIALGMAEMRRADVTPFEDPDTAAALWGVIAQARQALGEPGEARAALESAIEAAPEAERPTYQRRLAVLASTVARALAADADTQARADSEHRVTALGQATGWAECAVAALPGDAEAEALAADLQARLWPTYERTVTALVQRQEFRAARRLLRQALADPRVPGERVETFHALFSTTFSGEIGQLTAQAIRAVQDGREAEATAALRRVESLLERLSDEALSPERREEVGRRLAWGYAKLGERRLDAGDHEAALESLLRALSHEVDGERQGEIHALLGRAVAAVTDTRAGDARDAIERGEHDAALALCESLTELLRDAVERGVPAADLEGALAEVERLRDRFVR